MFEAVARQLSFTRAADELALADSDDFGQLFRTEVGHLFRLMSAGHSD